MADIENPNPPGTVSSGEIAVDAEQARDFDTVQGDDRDFDSLDQESDQDTNAESSITAIPQGFPFIPSLPNANNPFQDLAQNRFGGLAGTGGSPISAASVTQTRVERNTQSFVYRVTQVTSRFSQGKFTQNLEGVILNFDDYVSNASVNTNQAQDLNSGDAERQEGGFYGNTVTTNAAVEFQAGSTNNTVSVDRDFDTLDDTGGTGAAASLATTNSEGQTIGLESTTNQSSSNNTANASQVIARDD